MEARSQDNHSEKHEVDPSISLTLSRGLRIVELLAETGRPMSAQEISSTLGVNRAVTYRLLRTLGRHKLLDPHVRNGQYSIGLGLLTLSRGVLKDLREVALPILQDFAEDVGTTAFLGMRELDEVVCTISAEAADAMVSIRYREGLRRPVTNGASGIVLRSMQPASHDEGSEVALARTRGYAYSHGSIEQGVCAVSVPVELGTVRNKSCLTVIFPRPSLEPEEINRVAEKARSAAKRIVLNATQHSGPSTHPKPGSTDGG